MSEQYREPLSPHEVGRRAAVLMSDFKQAIRNSYYLKIALVSAFLGDSPTLRRWQRLTGEGEVQYKIGPADYIVSFATRDDNLGETFRLKKIEEERTTSVSLDYTRTAGDWPTYSGSFEIEVDEKSQDLKLSENSLEAVDLIRGFIQSIRPEHQH